MTGETRAEGVSVRFFCIRFFCIRFFHIRFPQDWG